MPITYEVSEDGKFVHTKMTGEVTEQDLVGYIDKFVSDERVKVGFSELIDATMGEGVGLSRKTAKRIVEMNRSHAEKIKGSKCAMVLQRDQEFWLAKYFEELNKELQTFIVFYNMDVAEKWLGCSTSGQ